MPPFGDAGHALTGGLPFSCRQSVSVPDRDSTGGREGIGLFWPLANRAGGRVRPAPRRSAFVPRNRWVDRRIGCRLWLLRNLVRVQHALSRSQLQSSRDARRVLASRSPSRSTCLAHVLIFACPTAYGRIQRNRYTFHQPASLRLAARRSSIPSAQHRNARLSVDSSVIPPAHHHPD
jgi:hypothetical protein